MAAALSAVHQEHPTAEVQLWAQDEHRVGLKPVLRRVWAPVGGRPTAVGWPRYQWTYLYGFVRPATGETWWLVLPTVNQAVFELALAEFARALDLGRQRRVVLVLDGAGWHSGIRLPEGLHLVSLPPYSPELQPAERLWPLTNEPLANRAFDSLADLEDVLGERCRTLRDDPDTVRALTAYHWWPTEPTPSTHDQSQLP